MKSCLAGLGHHDADVGHRGVVVVTDDLAPVDAALGVAPGDHGLDRVAHLLVETGAAREAPVVAVGDVDGGVGDALVGGARWRAPCRRATAACRTSSPRRSMPPLDAGATSTPVAVSEASNRAAPAARMPMILVMAEPPVRTTRSARARHPAEPRTGSRVHRHHTNPTSGNLPTPNTVCDLCRDRDRRRTRCTPAHGHCGDSLTGQ